MTYAFSFRPSTYWGRKHWIVLYGHRELGRISWDARTEGWNAFDTVATTPPPGGFVPVAHAFSKRTDAARALLAVRNERARHTMPPLDKVLTAVEQARYDVAYDANVHHHELHHYTRAGIDDAFDTLTEKITKGTRP